MRSRSRLLAAVMAVLLVSTAVAHADFTAEGGKLVGTGSVGAPGQGQAVAVSADGTTMITGGPGDNSSQGAAWVFVRSGTLWSQQGSKLVGTGAVGVAGRGVSVALSADGNTALVGGFQDNSQQGAVWVFVRNVAGTWSQQGGKLTAAAGVGTPDFGISAALSADGNTAIIGGYQDNSGAGAAWIYTRNGTLWSPGPKLVGTGAVGNAIQGTSVAISADGNTAVVGGPQDNANKGAAWIYTRTGGVWTQQGSKLVANDMAGASVYQGQSVSMSSDGNTVAVGAPLDASGHGAVWVYTRSGGVWTQQGAKIVGSGPTGSTPQQGTAVGLSGDGNTLLMGGPNDNANAGAIWFFTRSAGVWTQLGSKLVGAGAVGNAAQGQFAALSSDGKTAAEGGFADNSLFGATWVFVNASPAIVTIHDVPNDQGGKLSIRWTASSLDVAPGGVIDAYWIWRQAPIHMAAASASPASLAPDGSRRVTVAGAQVYYWEFVGSQPAHGYSAYSYSAPTLADSVPGSNPYTVFMVEAERTSTGEFWGSAPDSGYSVDNLPPTPPAPVAGAYAAGATHLHWGMSQETDLASYRVYRGSSADFVPDASSLVAAPADTGYVDAGAKGSYYKISALDTHGNESGFSLIGPSNTLGVGAPSLPARVVLAPVAPNPLRGGGVFHYSLPHAARVSVAVFDASGRLVRELAREEEAPGEHVARWDGSSGGGRAAMDGVYFLRLDVDGSSLSERFVRMR